MKYLLTITEHRTYEIEAGSEEEAMHRLDADPDDLPIGSLVSVDRSPPKVVGNDPARNETVEQGEQLDTDQASAGRTDPTLFHPRAY